MTGEQTPQLFGAQVPIGHPEAVPPRVLHRAIAASALGNATEWFDYGIYAYGVAYISAALFPGEAAEATLFALATFAISFLVRPLGGIFWGPLGDRYGRKTILAFTILLMSAATVGVGLIPSYERIGLWAPALLVALRIIQGFSTGGEYGGAATFMAEYSPDDRRGFYGSFLEFGTLAGFSFGALLMLGFSLALGEQAMHDWAWRIPGRWAWWACTFVRGWRTRRSSARSKRITSRNRGPRPSCATCWLDIGGRSSPWVAWWSPSTS